MYKTKIDNLEAQNESLSMELQRLSDRIRSMMSDYRVPFESSSSFNSNNMSSVQNSSSTSSNTLLSSNYHSSITSSKSNSSPSLRHSKTGSFSLDPGSGSGKRGNLANGNSTLNNSSTPTRQVEIIVDDNNDEVIVEKNRSPRLVSAGSIGRKTGGSPGSPISCKDVTHAQHNAPCAQGLMAPHTQPACIGFFNIRCVHSPGAKAK